MVDIARSPEMVRQIDELDHRNIYVIKKMITSLYYEFEKAVESGSKQKANYSIELMSMLYDKIKLENLFWANRIKSIMRQMINNLNKQRR